MNISKQKIFILLAGIAILLFFTLSKPTNQRTVKGFSVDYENDVFLKDGKTFDYVSGSLHYFRVPHQLWRDRLMKLRASGINVVSTYVPWNFHEPHQGKFVFSGDADLIDFIKTAQSLDLLVNIRPGPYICSEWDNGGLPYFVMGSPKNPIRLRSSDARFLDHVKRYFDVLLPLLRPMLYNNGGPVILVQVENEYGSDKTCDGDYMNYLHNLMKEHLGDDTVYYTADGWDMNHLICGPIHTGNVLTTVNFGPNTEHHKAYYRLRGFQKHGPLLNSEYYPGWLDHWGEPHQCRATELVQEQFEKMLLSKLGKVYVNFYMFFGGTNFGFYNGANFNNALYQPDPTSYDYDAPLSEAGDMTPKYRALQATITKHRPELVHTEFAAQARDSMKRGYGWVQLTEVLEYVELKKLATCHKRKVPPATFTELYQDYGLVLYEREVEGSDHDVLQVLQPRDSVSVYTDDSYVGKIYRNDETKSIVLLGEFSRLGLLVENMGRINYGPEMHDYKGLISEVILDGEDISQGSNWDIWCLPLNNTNKADFKALTTKLPGPGSLLRGRLVVLGSPADTWAKLVNFKKGLLFVNGHNLGRYWPGLGPQQHLYVPGVWLKEGANEVIVLELDEVPKTKDQLKIEFVDKPDVGKCSER